MRMFLGLGDICGYYSQLEAGLKAIGVPCQLVNAYPDRVYQRQHRPGLIGRVVEWIAQRRNASPRGSVLRTWWTAVQAAALVVLFISLLPRHDVFVFSGGTTFFARHDLRLLRWLRKRVIVVYHGTDARPAYLNAAFVGTAGEFDVDGCVRATAQIKLALREVEAFADAIINHSLTAHFHERKVVNWLHVGIPSACRPRPDPPTSHHAKQVVIVHAPTRPEPKGSPQIETAIESLRRKGHSIEFIKLVGRPNSEVLAALARCDFVVDELFSDMTMASFAAEAASFGKPAIVGLYGIAQLHEYAPAELIPPALVCHPEEVEPAIEKLIRDVPFRLALGAQAYEFVSTQWSPNRVAERFVQIASNELPADAFFDPASLGYLYGWGLTRRRVREVVTQIVNRHGIVALQLADKPRLESAFAEMARTPVGVQD